MYPLTKQLIAYTFCIGALSFFGTSNAGEILTYDKRSDFRSAILDAGIEKRKQGFNRVKGKKKGGQRSFAKQPLFLKDFSMAMSADEGVTVPKGKRNRITKRKRFRINKSKYAWVKTKDGVDLVVTFDNAIHAFGAKFRGLNNHSASTSIVLESVSGSEVIGELEPKKTRKRRRSFYGFISEEAFTSITFTGIDAFGMDKLIYGTMPEDASVTLFAPSSSTETEEPAPRLAAASVPAPGPLVLVSIGILGLGCTRLFKRRVMGPIPM